LMLLGASPMRYLVAVVESLWIFIVVVAWGAAGIPVLWFAIALVASAGLGIALGRRQSSKIVRGLVENGRFRSARVPGGVWFFIGLGLLIPIVAEILIIGLGKEEGWLVVRLGAVIVGVFAGAVFATIGVAIFNLERLHGRRVYLGVEGFLLDNA
ncbi:MAG TPA: hypothetical protein VMD30_02035, partial [Tepidisphaeraceae bacterium]|nr:hypothetical protein [Tepidisphaeraceae bacterium]